MTADPPGAGALVVLPTYEERDNLPRVVPAVLAALPGAEVLVVDDRSPDGTGELAEAMAREDGRVHVLHRDGPRGLGPAYVAGFRWALARPYRLVFQMDADLSHRPADLPALRAAADTYDLVLGSRYVRGGGVEGWPLHRRLLSRWGSFYARSVLGLGFRDLTGGFKCFRREVLAAIDLGSIRSRGYAFQVETTWRAWRAGFLVGEVPIVFPDRTAGRSKMSLAIAGEAARGVWAMRREGRPR